MKTIFEIVQPVNLYTVVFCVESSSLPSSGSRAVESSETDFRLLVDAVLGREPRFGRVFVRRGVIDPDLRGASVLPSESFSVLRG